MPVWGKEANTLNKGTKRKSEYGQKASKRLISLKQRGLKTANQQRCNWHLGRDNPLLRRNVPDITRALCTFGPQHQWQKHPFLAKAIVHRPQTTFETLGPSNFYSFILFLHDPEKCPAIITRNYIHLLKCSREGGTAPAENCNRSAIYLRMF